MTNSSRAGKAGAVAMAAAGTALLVAGCNAQMAGGAAAGAILPLTAAAQNEGQRALVAPDELRRQLAAQQNVAERDVTTWMHQHPRGSKDTFITFAITDLGPPPATSVMVGELGYLRQLKARRTRAGIAAADDLDQHGKLDIWNQYASQRPRDNRLDKQLASLQELLKQATKNAKSYYSRPSPRATEPDLAPGNFNASKTSYPSSHAAFAYAQQALLGSYDPPHAAAYNARAAQIAFSRLYVAGHFPSDVVAGAKLGYLLEAYVHDMT